MRLKRYTETKTSIPILQLRLDTQGPPTSSPPLGLLPFHSRCPFSPDETGCLFLLVAAQVKSSEQVEALLSVVMIIL